MREKCEVGEWGEYPSAGWIMARAAGVGRAEGFAPQQLTLEEIAVDSNAVLLWHKHPAVSRSDLLA